MATELVSIVLIIIMIVVSIFVPKIKNRLKKKKIRKNESHDILGMFRLENNSDIIFELLEYHKRNDIVRYKVSKYEDS